MASIPITVFMGFLGAGKTTCILSLLSQLPTDYKVVLLKNEYGDAAVDSALVKQSSLATVSEITNGCMCCVLVGQMKTALLEIQAKYHPDRIIIECSGSAFPATLAFQIRELERETDGGLKLDGIITVVDAENFAGYEDTSPTARMQASYTDLILINKSELVAERDLDIVMDHLHTLNDLTPKIKAGPNGAIAPDIIFGLDSKLFLGDTTLPIDSTHHAEVEIATVIGEMSPDHEEHNHTCVDSDCSHHHVKVLNGAQTISTALPATREQLKAALDTVSKEVVWRVKGFVVFSDGPFILNWAFGRFELVSTDALPHSIEGNVRFKFTMMGERGEIKRAATKFGKALEAATSPSPNH